MAAVKKIKLVLMDIDGVLTDGTLYYILDASGAVVEFKGFKSQDPIVLIWLADAGLRTGFISGRNSKAVEERLKSVKASFIYQGRLDKKNVFDEICRKASVSPEETLFIGDDLPDIPVFRACGLAVAVQNARPEVKACAHWITKARGGEGAVREVGEMLLKAQGRWADVLKRFDVPAELGVESH